MTTVHKNILILISIGLLTPLWSTSIEAEEVFFRLPGDRPELFSPGRKHVLYNVDAENEEPSHTLFIKNTKNEIKRKLYSYARYVDVLWSPKGTALLVNDHGGSDFTNSLIFLLEGKENFFDVKKEMKYYLQDNKHLFGNHHVYIEGVKWCGEEKVLIRISGYGDIDPKGFVLKYEYTLGQRFRLLQ